MRQRARIAGIVAVVGLAVVTAGLVVRSQAGSAPAGTAVATRGGNDPHHARALSGAGQVGTDDTTTTAPATTVPTPVTTAPAPAMTVKPVSPPVTAPAPGSTAGTSTTRPNSSTVTVPPVASEGPASGRLAVSVAVPQSNGATSRAIATMAADGSDEQVVATGDYSDPHWTSDGRYIVFESTAAYGTFAVPAGGGVVTHLSDAAASVISPDGSSVVNVLAVAYATGPPALAVQKIAEMPAGLVTVGPATPLGVSGVDPVWSPDGRRILYATDVGASTDLAIVNADGSGRRDLLATASVKAVAMDHPGFSADGSMISFVGTDNTAYFMRADGTDLRPALAAPVPGVTNTTAFATAWSADHQHLAVLLNGGNSVVVVNPAGDIQATAHLSVTAFPVGIAFDGSGQYVYFMSGPTAPPLVTRLYSVGLATGRTQPVGPGVGPSFPLAVLPG